MQAQSAYEGLVAELQWDEQVREDVAQGRRVGFYRVGRQLGAGTFSQVRLGTHLLCRHKVAIKILDKTRLENRVHKLLAREIAILEQLQHPHVIRLYEVCDTIAQLHIVTEFCPAGDLLARITQDGRLPESEARLVFAQLTAAAAYLHELQIVHRDIKAENVYFTARRVAKLGDFGFSAVCEPAECLNTCCGSPPYAAPELFRELPYQGVPVDLWALGVLLFFMVTGSMPFSADNLPQLRMLIVTGNFQLPEFVSPQCTSLVRALLRLNAPERMPLQLARKAPWLHGVACPDPPPSDPAAHQRVRDALTSQYGVPAELVNCAPTNVRSPVAGTYRILLHQLERRYLLPYECEQEQSAPQNNSQQHLQTSQKRQTHSSAACTLL